MPSFERKRDKIHQNPKVCLYEISSLRTILFVVTCPTWSWYKHQIWLATNSVWSCFSSYFIKYQATRTNQGTKGLPMLLQSIFSGSETASWRATSGILCGALSFISTKNPKPHGYGPMWVDMVSNVVIMALATSQDFLSMPQPPTSPDQEPWTENDTKAVQEAPLVNPWEIILTVIPYRFPPVWPSTTHIIIHIIPFPSRYIVVYIFVALSQHYPYLWSQDLAAETGK